MPPVSSRDSARFLTYPAQFFTLVPPSCCSSGAIRPLNLNLESLNKENGPGACERPLQCGSHALTVNGVAAWRPQA